MLYLLCSDFTVEMLTLRKEFVAASFADKSTILYTSSEVHESGKHTPSS